MDRMTTYDIHANAELLRSAHDEGALLEHLEAPLRSMVSELVSRAEKKPLSVYICSPDNDADSRNFFAYVLAMWVHKQLPATFLVDCDFLATGMSGIVPHHDALGYLDLLLYGTSLGVITQEAHAGVPVIGSGSFPVTKKRPFAMDAFDNTLRYLGNHSKCVFYCGPAEDDDGVIHPIAEYVDLVLVVNVADRFREGILDSLESSVISAKILDAWSIRINTSPPATKPRVEPVARPEVAPPAAPSIEKTAGDKPAVPEERGDEALVAEVEGLVEDGKKPTKEPEPSAREPAKPVEKPTEKVAPRPPVAPATSPGEKAKGPAMERPARERPAREMPADARPSEAIAGPALRRRTRGSRLLRIVTPVVGIFLIAFVIWWLYLTKSVREREQELAGTGPATPVPEVTTQPADSAGTPSTSAGETTPVAPQDTKPAPTPDTEEPATPGDDVYTRTTNGVPMAERLDGFANQYLVHVSSFRRLDRARDEALYLMGWDYPVFLYRIDLGGKGIWYRVYVGPAETRDEARAFKIKLDENPRIQSTRIARVPG
jgi:hypothetical protein